MDFDYVAIGADEQSEKMIEALGTTEDVFRMTLLKETTNDANSVAMGISIDEDGFKYLNKDIMPTRLPKNEEVILSSGLANLLDAEVGEYVNIGYETTQYSLKVIEVVEATANILYVDATHFGLSNDMLCIKSDCEVDSDGFNAMRNLAEARGVDIRTRYELLSVITKTIKLYSTLLKYIVAIAILTSFIGVANTLITGYTESSNDRAIYYSLGMTKRDVRLTETVKILTPIILATLLSIPISYGMLRIIDIAIASFGIDMLH
jgi:ABC-type lipoprotein release transport system permease subunit